MSPAGSTILRNVLIETVGQVRDTIYVCPGKRVREVCSINVLVRTRGREGFKNIMSWKDLRMRNGIELVLSIHHSYVIRTSTISVLDTTGINENLAHHKQSNQQQQPQPSAHQQQRITL